MNRLNKIKNNKTLRGLLFSSILLGTGILGGIGYSKLGENKEDITMYNRISELVHPNLCMDTKITPLNEGYYKSLMPIMRVRTHGIPRSITGARDQKVETKGSLDILLQEGEKYLFSTRENIDLNLIREAMALVEDCKKQGTKLEVQGIFLEGRLYLERISSNKKEISF